MGACASPSLPRGTGWQQASFTLCDTGLVNGRPEMVPPPLQVPHHGSGSPQATVVPFPSQDSQKSCFTKPKGHFLMDVLTSGSTDWVTIKPHRSPDTEARMDILCMNGNVAKSKIGMSPAIRVVTSPEPQLEPHKSCHMDLPLCSF